MTDNDLEYLRRRAADEAANAVRAASPRAAALHSELAEGYTREIEKLKSRQPDLRDEDGVSHS